MMKRVICDSSALISLSTNCMLPLIVDLSEKVDFIITSSVYDEVVTNPSRIRKYKLGSLRFAGLVDNGILKVEEPDSKDMAEILKVANSVYWAGHRPIRIIHQGEAEVLSLANDGDTMLIDERTMRFLIESPQEMRSLLQHRIHRGVRVNRAALNAFQMLCRGVGIIRSSEIVAVSYEQGILEKYFGGNPLDILESCLWALKYSGCSLANEEVYDYLRISK